MDSLLYVTAKDILEAGALEIRDIPLKITNEEVEKLPLKNQPFLYASGNWGPGYVSIKGLVGRNCLIKSLAIQLAAKISVRLMRHVDFVAGNVTGGVIPGWLLKDYLCDFWGRNIPFVYIRDSRKKGGHKELITGITNNIEIIMGDRALVIEELANFTQTTCNSALLLRQSGYRADYAACIMYYDNPEANKLLSQHGIEMIYLFTLTELLSVADKEKTCDRRLIDEFWKFLTNPLLWQEQRGLTPIETGGTK